jgi:hypothetical protein
MAFRARQITLVASTATPCLVVGTTGTHFPNIAGSVTDELPCTIKNEDLSAIVYVGGPDVSSTAGQSIEPGGSQTYNLYSTSDIPYIWSSGTPIVSVLCSRQ